MNTMHVIVSDTAGTSGTVTVERSEVAAAIRPWFTPDASPQVEAAIDRLQQSLDRAPADQLGTEESDLSTTRLCAYLGIELRLADADRQVEEAAIMGEPKPSTDEIPSASKPIEGDGTCPPGFFGGGAEISVVVVVLVVVSAIGSGLGMMLARKARAARQRGTESTRGPVR